MVFKNQQANKFLFDAVIFTLSNVALYFGVKYVLSNMDPLSAKKKASKQKSSKILKRLDLKGEQLELTEYEEVIATEVIHPNDINVTFGDVGGLEVVIDSLEENVIYPLVYPGLYSSVSALLSAPKGVLLYGPPGCGKTMLAKALAKESGATFINLHVSTLTEKYFGESQKLVHALFSLAQKLAPTIIFIDEIDSFLRERSRGDHEATGMMKAEFMSLWDGLAGQELTRVLVLGATNRPNDIDKAILRRMPKRFPIELPSPAQRKRILTLLLKDMPLAKDFDINRIVEGTNGFSGSDLKEMCRNAAMVPVRESIRKIKQQELKRNAAKIGEKEEWGSGIEGIDPKEKIQVRRLVEGDFFEKESGVTLGRDGTISGYVDLD